MFRKIDLIRCPIKQLKRYPHVVPSCSCSRYVVPSCNQIFQSHGLVFLRSGALGVGVGKVAKGFDKKVSDLMTS